MRGVRPASKPGERVRRPVGSSLAVQTAISALVLVALAAPAGAQSQEADPWQGMNRRTFAFNEWLDMNVLMPVAKGWDFVAPDAVQTGIANVFETSGMSVVFLLSLIHI